MSTGSRVVRIEWAVLEGRRPHPLGRNARLPPHGASVRVPLCRLTTSDGTVGVGLSRLDDDLAWEALGQPLGRLFDGSGTAAAFTALDFPLWDLAARAAGVPVYALAARRNGKVPPSEPPVVDCYDTSLYFDDLGPDVEEPARLAARAAESRRRGHHAFKVKVGRGGRWMAPEEGLERDVAVIEQVRRAVGPASIVLADANNGYTLKGAEAFLARTADAAVGWLEEPFAEDPVLLAALGEWLEGEGLAVLVADGETATTAEAAQLAAGGSLDVVQCDILRATFTGWLDLGRTLDGLGVASAPHHFGLYLGNYLSGHLVPAVDGLRYIEWDEAEVPGLAPSGYELAGGQLRLSAAPGFGVELDEALFARAVRTTGFELRATGAR